MLVVYHMGRKNQYSPDLQMLRDDHVRAIRKLLQELSPENASAASVLQFESLVKSFFQFDSLLDKDNDGFGGYEGYAIPDDSKVGEG